MATCFVQNGAGGLSNSKDEFAFLKYHNSQVSDSKSLPHATKGPTKNLSVKHDGTWSYCGPLISPSSLTVEGEHASLLGQNFQDFVTATFTAKDIPNLLPLLEFVNTYLSDIQIRHYLLTVRASTSTDEFNRPRWHTDELFFADRSDGQLPGTGIGLSSNYGSKASKKSLLSRPSKSPSFEPQTSWKMCTTLLGPSTLFIPQVHQSTARAAQQSARKAASTDHTCNSIRCVGCASAADAVRESLATGLADFDMVTAGEGECAVFRVGSDFGAMHSEPVLRDLPQGRIFINIVPGTETELRNLARKWGMEYPRHWWISKGLMDRELNGKTVGE